MTREQIRRIYDMRMQALHTRNARESKKQDDADRAVYMKQQQSWDKATGIASLLNVAKDIYEGRQTKLLKIKYDKPEMLDPKTKYELKEDRSFGEVINPKNWLENIKRLTPKGGLEETEGYKEFKALEETGVAEESLKGWINPETGKQGTAQEYAKLVKAADIQQQEMEEMDLLEEQLAQKAEIGAQKAADIQQQEMEEEELAEVTGFLEEQKMKKLEIQNIENAKFNQYGLTKTRAQELSNILEREGVVIPPGMTEEKTLELLSSFDKVPMGKYPVGSDQEEYRAFVDTLKSGSQNADTFQSVVTDLTTNTDQTIQSVIDGTYVPEVEDVSYERDLLKEKRDLEQFIEGEEAFLFEDPGMSTVETGAPGDEFIEAEYTKELEEWQKDLGVGEDGVFTAEELENMPASAAIILPTGAPGAKIKPADLILDERILDKDYPLTNDEIAKRLGLQSADQILREDIQSATEMFPDLSQEEALDQYYNYGDIEGTASTGLDTMEDIAALEGGDTVPTVDAPTAPSTDIVSDVKPDVEIPDAEPGLVGEAFKLGGKTLNSLKTVQDMSRIGQTLTNEEASNADKAIAGTQGVKMLADMAAKKAGKETAAQIGSKALTKKGYEQLTKEGVKMGGKAAVGTAAGGVIGGYTMVTEGKAAGESWEEGDYDEAILHGISSISGGLQTAGAGMMLTGVGAPLGAVLYGVGTAASLISSGAQMLESLFGGDDTAQAEEAPKQKFNATQYLNSIRRSRYDGRAYA
tara:strand:+ start:2044 stop:4299 length:2256 start_codon:yes stop_codon:yes gene_type:complete